MAGPTPSPCIRVDAVAKLRKEIAAQERAGRLLKHHLGVAAVRPIDVTYALAAAEVDHFAVSPHARRAIHHIVQRHQA
jgi:hypothetical protein